MPKPATLPATSAATLREQHNTSPAVADQIEIAQIDEAIQVRAETDQETVERYAELYRADKHALPPIIVYEEIDPETEAGRWYVADGNHRLAAAKLAKLKEIDAIRRKGTRRDAQLFAISDANHSHGLHLTNADKRRMVELLLADEEWRQWSDRELARRTHTSPSFVGGIRSTVHGAQTTTRKSKDGVTRQVDNIGKTPRSRGILTVIASEIDAPIPIEGVDGRTIRITTQDELNRIAAHVLDTVMSTSEARGKNKPAKINPVQIGSQLYLSGGSIGRSRQTLAVRLVPIVTAEVAKAAQFRADVIARADDGTRDLLGLRLTWKGAPDDCVAGTYCDTVELMTKAEYDERCARITDGDDSDEDAGEEPETLSPASVATTPNEPGLHKWGKVNLVTRNDGTDLWRCEHCGKDYIRRGLAWHAPEGGCPKAPATSAPHPDEESDDEQDGPTVQGDETANTPSWARADDPAPAIAREKKTKTQTRDQLIGEQLAELLEAGKVGRLSIHQVAALAAVTGCEDNTELTYNDQLVSNACYELSKTVGAEIAHHLRHQTSKLKQLPKLPQLCALFGADYDTFAARASAAVEG